MKTAPTRPPRAPLALALAAALAALVPALASCDFFPGISEDPLYADNVDLYSGTLAGDASFAAGRVAYVTDMISVPAGTTLTVQPGAVVKFAPDAGIEVQDGGRLVADGTAEAPIVFTCVADDAAGGDSQLNGASAAPVPGSYSCIWIHEASNSNIFDHCEFRYGGADDRAVLYLDGAAAVTACDFHDNLGGIPGGASHEAVLHVRTWQSATSVRWCRFWNNRWPLAIPVNMDLDDSNEFSFDPDGAGGADPLVNEYKQVFVDTYDRSSTIERAVSWSETELPFCVYDDIVLIGTESVSGSLTLADGVVMKFNAGQGLSVEAAGALTGAFAEFTSIDDDSLLGDARNDGPTAEASVATWDGIWDVDLNAYLDWTNIHYSVN